MRLFTSSVLGALLAMVVGASSASAAVERPFVPRFAANATGDITLAANTLMTCPAVAGCAGTQQGLGPRIAE